MHHSWTTIHKLGLDNSLELPRRCIRLGGFGSADLIWFGCPACGVQFTSSNEDWKGGAIQSCPGCEQPLVGPRTGPNALMGEVLVDIARGMRPMLKGTAAAWRVRTEGDARWWACSLTRAFVHARATGADPETIWTEQFERENALRPANPLEPAALWTAFVEAGGGL